MSRKINLEEELSDRDRQYLVDRAMHAELALNAEFMGDGPADVEVINDGNTGDVDQFKADDGSDLLAGSHPGEITTTVVQAVEVGQEPEPLVPSDGVKEAGSAESDFDDDYDDTDEDGTSVWLKADLVEEAEKRGLSTSGTKAELIARLREDDAK